MIVVGRVLWCMKESNGSLIIVLWCLLGLLVVVSKL